MVYNNTSLKPVIARVIRNTRITDMTYADDMVEWIGEALNRMLIRWRLEKTHCEIEIKNHTGKLPCGLVSIGGVIYEGRRLRKGTGSIDTRALRRLVPDKELSTYFVTDTTIQAEDVNSQNYSMVRGDNIKLQTSASLNEEFYDLQYNYIKTSFCDGCITLCFTKADLDKEGYPLVPDLEESREACFWYVASRLCITGYKLPDPSMDFRFCENQAKIFFRKAKNIIKTQSVDEKETQVQLMNNLIPPADYYSSFFVNAEQIKPMRR